MSLWKRTTTLAALNQMSAGCLVGQLGILFTRLEADHLEASMPVDSRTTQPFGLLHGGASVALAETLGSVAGYLCTEGQQQVVGLEVNANHLRAVRHGSVRGVCRALHSGRSHQVWQIDIYDEAGQHCCAARLTTAIRNG